MIKVMYLLDVYHYPHHDPKLALQSLNICYERNRDFIVR